MRFRDIWQLCRDRCTAHTRLAASTASLMNRFDWRLYKEMSGA